MSERTHPAGAPAVARGSEQGRRILIAAVTGEAGDRIQAWRRREDPEQACRYPPHVTLCYRMPEVEAGALERQVRHAFAHDVTVRLGGVRVFDGGGRTAYVEVFDPASLDAARDRLYDGRWAALPPSRPSIWHVTCLRSGGGDPAAIERARAELTLDCAWRVERVEYRELRGERYRLLADWTVAR